MSGNFKIPQSYTISKFQSYAGNPKTGRTYLNGECPICKEGNSKGHKKRLFYMLNDDYLYCHNCQMSWTPYFWIKTVTGMSFREIMNDVKDYTGCDVSFESISFNSSSDENDFELPALPGECVNLLDELQLKYYSNFYIVQIALNYCKTRRLFTAINRPKTFYVCIKDNYHRNRLIIPYYDEQGKIIHYISRKIIENDDKAKYLLKFNSGKPIFNFNKIDPEYPYIFLFEGQIDSMFIKNGIAIGGVDLTQEQEETINASFPLHKKIWVFDNFRLESKEVVNKIKTKAKEGETIFLYDGNFSEVKDLNEFCVKKNLDSVNPDLIVGSSYKGLACIMKLT